MNIKRKIKMMDALVVILFMMVIAFIVTMICVFLRMGSVPDTLIVSTFAWMGFEAGAMAAIKKNKDRLQAILDKEEAKRDAGKSSVTHDQRNDDNFDNRGGQKNARRAKIQP